MRRAWLLTVFFVACEHGGTPPAGTPVDGGPAPDGTTPASQPERSCRSEVRFVGNASSVEVAGEWNWEARTPLVQDSGVWSAQLDLPAGLHAYKLIVDGQWQLDPARPWRKYEGGVENSALRVPDCKLPLVELDSFADEVTLRIFRGAGGAEVTSLTATLRHDFGEHAVPVELLGAHARVKLPEGLSAGKYTLIVSAEGGEPLHLPFWREAEAFDWRGEPIYMLMVDRFRDGNPGNNPARAEGAASTADFAGGDLAGVTAALEDGTFERLGIKVLWLSPFVANAPGVEGEGDHGVTGYHGYWPIDGRAIDPRFGTPAELEALVKAAHARGVRVLMDLVLNHVHQEHPYLAAHPGWFRTGCVCGTDGCGWTEERLACLFHPYMPDIDWTISEASEQLVADALFWLDRYDLDGFRVDAVKHVEDLAIRHLRAAIRERFEQAGTSYFLLGETAMGWAGHDLPANQNEYDTIGRYLGPDGLSGQFDFVLYHAVAYRVFARHEHGFLHADFWTRQSLLEYPAEAIMTPFLGSHDSSRFMSLAEENPAADHKWPEQGLPAAPTSDTAYDRAALAYTWLFGLPGAPLLYYGDEYGEYGGNDPDNRHMWRGPTQRSPRETAFAARIEKVLQARRSSRALRLGSYRTLVAEEDVLVFAREHGEDVAVVALNRGEAPVERTIDVTGPLRDVLNDVDAAGTIAIPARGAAIFTRP